MHEILKNIVYFDKLKVVPLEHKRGCLILGRTEVERGNEEGKWAWKKSREGFQSASECHCRHTHQSEGGCWEMGSETH